MKVSHRKSHYGPPHFSHGLLKSSASVKPPTKEELAAEAARAAKNESLIQVAQAETAACHALVREIERYIAHIQAARDKGRKPRLAKKPLREAAWNMGFAV